MSAQKTGDLSLHDFEETVKTAIVDEISKAVEQKISPDEISSLIRENYSENKDISLLKTIKRIKKQIQNRIEIASASKVKGCIIGSRDKFGRPSPIRYLLLRPDKKHLEISNFGHKTVYGSEDEHEIPVPSLCTVSVLFDPEFNSWNMKGLAEIEKEKLTPEQAIKVMSGVAIGFNEITSEMSWAKDRPATPIVLQGTMNRIRSEAVFRRENDSTVVDHYNDVWVENAEGSQPCFTFGLKASGGRFIRCHIEHQQYGRPTLMVDDLEILCKRAVEKYPESPEKQTHSLEEWLVDMPVLVAGVISGYRETTNQEGKAVTNIEIGVAAIIQLPEEPVDYGVKGQEKLKQEPEKPPAEPTTPSQSYSKTHITDAKEDIQMFCELTGLKPTELTLDTIRRRATRFKNIPDGAILEAIAQLQEEASKEELKEEEEKPRKKPKEKYGGKLA